MKDRLGSKISRFKLFKGKLRLLVQVSRINLRQSLITLIGITIALTMISASLIYLESNKTKALGMKFRQVFLLMFIEPFFLILISGIPGALIGLGLLMTFLSFGQGPPFSHDPPFMLILDIPSVLLIYGSIFITVSLAGFITSYRATRANISKILKVE